MTFMKGEGAVEERGGDLRALSAYVDAARSAWPDLLVDAEDFARYVTERAPGGVLPAAGRRRRRGRRGHADRLRAAAGGAPRRAARAARAAKDHRVQGDRASAKLG